MVARVASRGANRLIPKISQNNLKILDKYIIREFLKIFLICLIVFVFVFLLIEITDKIKYYFHYNPPGLLMLKYFLVKIPGYLFFTLPMAILLGGMLSLLMMAKHSELIAMQAGGVDAISIARPMVLVGLIGSTVMFLANETFIPWSNRYSEYIQNVEIAGKKETTFVRFDQIWLKTPGSIVHINKYDKVHQTLEKVSVVRWDADFNFVEKLFADKAKWWKNRWIFYGVNRTTMTKDGKFVVDTIPSMTGPLDKTPGDFEKGETPTKEMNLTQLGDLIDQLEAEGRTPTRYLVDWHDKIAFPFVCLIMAVLSVPFAVRVSPRGGGMAIGLVYSLAIAFSYWILHTMFIALGHGGYIPPIAAAWAANTLFGLATAVLLLNAST
ncbi:MAG: LPS export ABC transporter permease LptG [Deltaproteobacteria bacterium]|nr:LPS export ABC transporter permease LptG [Deltaproteobacteria bacterium]